jgi:hypothetical protein
MNNVEKRLEKDTKKRETIKIEKTRKKGGQRKKAEETVEQDDQAVIPASRWSCATASPEWTKTWNGASGAHSAGMHAQRREPRAEPTLERGTTLGRGDLTTPARARELKPAAGRLRQ